MQRQDLPVTRRGDLTDEQWEQTGVFESIFKILSEGADMQDVEH